MPDQGSIANRLLMSLATDDYRLLGPHLEAVELPLRRQLETRNKRIDHVYSSGRASPPWWPMARGSAASK